MTTVRKGDFVQVEYTGKITEDNTVFDTTDEATSKKNDIHNPDMKYGNVIICLGEHQLLKGLEDEMAGKELGKEYTVTLAPENAFGKKDAKRIKLMPTNVFRKQRIDPVHGLQVNIDGVNGIIKTVTGGRTIVDFNHPLSGKEITYTISMKRVITDAKEKITACVMMQLGTKDVKVGVEGETAAVTLPVDMPNEIGTMLEKKILELVPQIKNIVFRKEDSKKDADGAKEDKTTGEA